MLKRGEGDIEIKKLHKIAGRTDYGCFMFSRNMLQSLYGDSGPRQVESDPSAEMVYKSRKRDLSQCQFRDHPQTAGQKRINKRIGRKWGLEHVAMMLGGVAQLGGKEHGVSQKNIDGTVAFVEANIEKTVDPDGIEDLGGR